MIVSQIFCIDREGGLGKDGDLLFKIPWDLKNFKKKTTEGTIIMGRKTHESIGKLLPNRKTIILSRDPNYKVEGAEVFQEISDALEYAGDANQPCEEVFIVGGASIYLESLKYVDKLYITLVDTVKDSDTSYPTPILNYIMDNFTINDENKNMFKIEEDGKEIDVLYVELSKNN